MWSVYRQSNGDMVETGFQSQVDAILWAKANCPNTFPDKWWYVDREPSPGRGCVPNRNTVEFLP